MQQRKASRSGGTCNRYYDEDIEALLESYGPLALLLVPAVGCYPGLLDDTALILWRTSSLASCRSYLHSSIRAQCHAAVRFSKMQDMCALQTFSTF